MSDLSQRERRISIYVHVPFCMSKCAYCDFDSVVYGAELADAYLSAVSKELATRAAHLTFDTLYIGGGTPTCLSPKQLETLFAAVRCHAKLEEGAEFTVETNPASTIKPLLCICGCYGANRISVGVQTFQERFLRVLGRRHSSSEAREAVAAARKCGFEDVSLDLICGVPGETLDDWASDLSEAIACGPEHISAYCLTLEKGTPLARMVSEGKLTPQSPEDERAMMEMAIGRLGRAGYVHYEISNYAKPSFECRHNIRYWENRQYVGVGPSAASYLEGVRTVNVADVATYCSLVESGQGAVGFEEKLEPEKRARETLILGMRMRAGVDLDLFRKRTGFDALELCAPQFDHLADMGLVAVEDGALKLTAKGVYLADTILSEFV